jgi:hypothetical protein
MASSKPDSFDDIAHILFWSYAASLTSHRHAIVPSRSLIIQLMD